MLSKSLVSLLLNAITTFRYKFQIQTSVLMSGAIREAISSCYFKIYQVLKKNFTWRFWSARYYSIA